MANTNKSGVQFTAYIPQTLLDALRSSAEQAHRSMNAQLVYYLEQGLEREEIMGTLQEAIQAKEDGKVVLAEFAGRRVTINAIGQNEQTKEWFVKWSHKDYPGAQFTDVDETIPFIIRGRFGSYR